MSNLADQYMHCIADILIKWSVRIRSQVAARPHCSWMCKVHREQTTYICNRRGSHVGLQCLYALCLQSCLKHETNQAQNSRGIFNHLGDYFLRTHNRELACLRLRERLDGLVVATGVGMMVRFRSTLLMPIKLTTPSMSTSLTVS
jgi:hypothetical protein